MARELVTISEPCARCTCTVIWAGRSLEREGITPIVSGVLPMGAEIGFFVRVDKDGKHWFRPIAFCSSECAENWVAP